MIETLRHGKLQPTQEEYKALEAASLKLAKDATNFSEEVQALGKRRTETVYTEGRKLLSTAESTRSDLITSSKLKNRATFIRNIQLFFNGPKGSKLDSAAVKARKRLTRERCEQIRSLGTDEMTLWAAAFAPSQWEANLLPKPTFEEEEPLQSSPKFQEYLNGTCFAHPVHMLKLRHDRYEAERRIFSSGTINDTRSFDKAPSTTTTC
ncbi:conserved hypothetical protein [Histoplasma capsulatum H143]|uniref:Uncharacterized protein n=1 Tax=Ajellomyces capsulatus (strain H143) TaxID=544712 RepID=C6HDX8_AJECH|nr:conserved hypothetical protein [Histoplasma capsulatum H143]